MNSPGQNEIKTHLGHCDQGEYEGVCKYGEEETCPVLQIKRGIKKTPPPIPKDAKEVVCKVCGTIATSPEYYCSHLAAGKGDAAPEQRSAPVKEHKELPGMPEKGEAHLIAEDMLDLRDHIREEKKKMDMLKAKFVAEMHAIKESYLLVKGWEFDVEATDKITITKKK